MDRTDLGQIIARRELTCDGKPVRVLIGMPQRLSDPEDYLCPYEIDGPYTKKLSRVIGIDAVQALQLVMVKIGVDLEASDENRTGRLRWLDESGYLGFPSTETLAEMLRR